MESLVNYGTDDENDSPSSSKEMSGAYGPARSNSNEDNYDAVVMDMSEKLLNLGNKSSPTSGHFKSYRGTGTGNPAIAYNYSNGVDSNASSRSPSPKPTKPAPTKAKPSQDEDASLRRKDKDRRETTTTGSGRDRDRDRDRSPSRDKSAARNDRDRSKGSGRERERDRHHRVSSRDRDHERRDHDRGRDRDRVRDRDRDRDRDDKHASRRGDERRKRKSGSRSRSRSASRSVSGSPARSSDKYRRGSDKRRNQRKNSRDSPSSSSTKGRGDRDRERDSNSSGRQNISRPGARPGNFYHSKLNNKINVLERLGIALKPTELSNPQAFAQRAGEQQAAQVKLATGVEIASYLNPAATQRFAEQMHKKRLLWGARKDDQSGAPAVAAAATAATSASVSDPLASKWQGTTFAQDHDGKVAAKFNRLMGIKGASDAETKLSLQKGDDIIKKQEEMFHNMESQYEVARLATHTHRGLGLGFGAFQPR